MSSTPLEKQKQTKIGFAVTVGGIAFVISAALPPLAYLLLCGTAISLLLYQAQWENITVIHPPLELDKTSLTLAGFGVLIAGIFLLPLNPLNQAVLYSLIGAGLGFYFADQCVQKSQPILNQSLIEAVKSMNVEEVKRLLKLGADPFAPDALSNTAFHYRIQHHANSHVIFLALQHQATKADHDFNSVLVKAKTLFTDSHIREQYTVAWQHLKTCFNQNNEQNRKALNQAITGIFEAYLPVLKDCLKTVTRYLRERAAYPKDMSLVMKEKGGEHIAKVFPRSEVVKKATTQPAKNIVKEARNPRKARQIKR